MVSYFLRGIYAFVGQDCGEVCQQSQCGDSKPGYGGGACGVRGGNPCGELPERMITAALGGRHKKRGNGYAVPSFHDYNTTKLPIIQDWYGFWHSAIIGF